MVKINYVSSSFKLNSNLQGKVKPISKISKMKDKPKDENNKEHQLGRQQDTAHIYL